MRSPFVVRVVCVRRATTFGPAVAAAVVRRATTSDVSNEPVTAGGASAPRGAGIVAPVAVPALTGLQTEAWRLLWQQFLRDAEALAECRVWEERRRRAAPEMRALLQRFLASEADLEELRATVDRRTRGDWDAFGLRGASGAMFLNQLARRATGEDDGLTLALRSALRAPDDEAMARDRLADFIAALRAADGAGAGDLGPQPARAAFFVSAWWHVQDAERWPIFQPSARRALREEQDVYAPTGEPATDYVVFRAAFLAVAAALRATTWELEYLCWWRQQREVSAADDRGEPLFYEPGAWRAAPSVVREPRPARPRRAPTDVAAEVPAPRSRTSRERPVARETPRHTQVQWLLARMGRQLGCRVWIAANDWSKRWEGQALGELSVRRLPSLGLAPDSQRVVSLIDVVWLRAGNEVAAAFEIEHTTSVYSGLLRMADLAALSPNLRFPLYIVAPRARLDKVRRELARPTFRALGLHRRCAFFSGEALLDAADSIMRWANDPSAIERLASRADDVTTDTLRELDEGRL